MKTFEIWKVKNIEGKFLYDNRFEKENEYKFCTQQETTEKAIDKIKEIFKKNFGVEKFLNEKLAGEDYLFSAKINNNIENFIMFE